MNFTQHLESAMHSGPVGRPFFHYDAPEPIALSRVEFHEEVCRISAWLGQHGVGPNQPLLLVLEHPLKWILSFFSAVRVGALPVLVNFKDAYHLKKVVEVHPQGRVWTDRSEGLSFPLPNERLLLYPAPEIRDEKASIGEPVQKSDNDLFLGIYTSGTSGAPKYLEKSYRNMITELSFLKELLGISSRDTVLSVVPQLHIYGLLFSVLLPPMVGASIVRTEKLLPREVMKLSKSMDASFLVAAPIHYQAFVNSEIEPENIHRLRLAISSGAPLKGEIARPFVRQTKSRILELYGSTETGGMGYRFWEEEQEAPFHFFPYLEAKKLDEEGGELMVRSPAISKNALGTSEEWYRTGDFAELVSSSQRQFRILGRRQQILKVAGKRLSTLQLEEELKSLPYIEQAAVVREQESGFRGEHAVAFVELKKGSGRSPGEIKKDFLKISGNAPVLRNIVVLEEIPRDQNGKIRYAQIMGIGEKR